MMNSQGSEHAESAPSQSVAALRVVLVAAACVGVLGAAATAYMLLTHNADDGANIGGGIGIIGSSAALTAAGLCFAARRRRRSAQVTAAVAGGLLLLVAIQMLSLVRPFE